MNPLRIEPITDFDDPRLRPYRNMKRQEDQAEEEIFIAEGEKVTRRLLESPLRVLSVVLPPKWVEPYRPLLEKRGNDAPVFTAEKDVLEKMTGFTFYQGVMAVGRIPPPLPVEQVLASAPRPLLLAAVDGLSNAENMGVLVRNAAAFGAQALITGETCCPPYLRRAVRSSMGTIFKMPVVYATGLAPMLRRLRSAGIRCIAAHPHTDRRTVFEADFTGDCCVVFGSEGLGLSPEVRDACDEAVLVPMHNDVDSLNVGSASAVFLFEAARQRRSARTDVP